MAVLKYNYKYFFILLIISFLKLIFCSDTINLEGLKYAKALKLYGGKLIVAGDVGIYTYESDLTRVLPVCPITEDIIPNVDSSIYTTLAQFPTESKGLVLIIVMHVLYIFNSEGVFQFKKQLDIITSNIKFYTLVPYTYIEDKYHFILGYINNEQKAFLQYYLITLDNEQISEKGFYQFEGVSFNNGISCQIMNHEEYGDILTCFYHDTTNNCITYLSFDIQDEKIEELSITSDYFSDKPFCIQSVVDPEKKNSLVCYVQDNGDSTKNNGYCALYNIDQNKFLNQDKYIYSTCQSNINHISLNYFRESKEYIFSCTEITADIYFIKFDQDFNPIRQNSNSGTDDKFSVENCQYTQCYSIILLSNKYQVLADLKCNEGDRESAIYNTSSEYNPSVIYTESPEESDESEESTRNDDKLETDSDSNDIESICNKYKNSEGTICSEIVPEGYYIIDSLLKLIEKCDNNCKSCINDSKNCLSCYENFELNIINSICLYKYNYFYNKTIQEMIYLLSNELCPDILPYEIVKTKECVEDCLIDEFINETCKINKFSKNNIDSITENIRKIVNISNNLDYNVIINGNNIIYEITTTEVHNDNDDISSIDFGECENILKQNQSINYLIVFKIDIKLDDSVPKKVEYEVYSPETKQKLDLSICKKSKIDVYVPLGLDDYTNDLFDSVKQYGYDILNENDSFYQDLCTPFTSRENTDISMSDRQKNIFNNSIRLCEDGCEYVFYNTTNKKAKCRCQVKTQMREMKIISYRDMNLTNLFDIKTISNIELIKCYKLAFSLEGQENNYGSLILIVMILIYISIFVFHLIKKKSSISQILRRALKLNIFPSPPRKEKKNKSQVLGIHSLKNINSNNSNIDQQSGVSLNISKKQNSIKSRKSEKKNLIFKIKNYQNINLIKNANIIYKNKKRSSKKFKNISGRKKSSVEIISQIQEKNNFDNNKEPLDNNYIEDELNLLDYDIALKLDHRTYGQYYWSLVKKKQIILFIFVSYKDYNIIYMKIGLFIISFCLYFSVNALFFTDQTMHKIYNDKGFYKILNQLPHILYSSLISTIVNMVIKRYAITEKEVLELSKEKNRIKCMENAVNLYKQLIIRLNIYFCITIFILIIFWFYLSAFCAVYKNTQIILIKNTLLCFSLTLIYPFCLNLFPGIFRMLALKAEKKDKECLYKSGNLLALLL